MTGSGWPLQNAYEVNYSSRLTQLSCHLSFRYLGYGLIRPNIGKFVWICYIGLAILHTREAQPIDLPQLPDLLVNKLITCQQTGDSWTNTNSSNLAAVRRMYGATHDKHAAIACKQMLHLQTGTLVSQSSRYMYVGLYIFIFISPHR